MDEYGGTEKNATVYGLLLEEMVGGSMFQPFANFRSQVLFQGQGAFHMARSSRIFRDRFMLGLLGLWGP